MSVGLLALYMIFVAAGFPMMTFLCGSGDLILVCPMGDCSAPPVTDLAFTSPPCCIGVEQRSDMTEGVIVSAKVEQTLVVSSFDIPAPQLADQDVRAIEAHVAGTSPPLHLLTHTLLI
jgi:hypothetical protein